MEISYTTGHVTWEAAHVILGNYSVQVVVEDIFTNIRVSCIMYSNPSSLVALQSVRTFAIIVDFLSGQSTKYAVMPL